MGTITAEFNVDGWTLEEMCEEWLRLFGQRLYPALVEPENEAINEDGEVEACVLNTCEEEAWHELRANFAWQGMDAEAEAAVWEQLTEDEWVQERADVIEECVRKAQAYFAANA